MKITGFVEFDDAGFGAHDVSLRELEIHEGIKII